MKKLLVLFYIIFFNSYCLCETNSIEVQDKRDILRSIVTDYGIFDVTEPVLCELLDHPVLLRIKKVEQYGIYNYIFPEYGSYSRYKHCVGVWVLLRRFGASIEEQIAGLLHDVSHTVFSHAGDLLFKHVSEKNSYQDDIHEWFLRSMGIDVVLQKFGLSLESILHKNGLCKLLEQELPDICVDRLEYNLQGGLLEKMLTMADVQNILNDISFEHNMWFFHTPVLARKLADVALYHTENVWGGLLSYCRGKQFNTVLQEALDTGVISTHDIHFSTDDIVWEKLCLSSNALIKKQLYNLLNMSQGIVDNDVTYKMIKTKFRGINPWVKQGDILKRLTDIDQEFKENFEQVAFAMANLLVPDQAEIVTK